jgi:effector-binding domain-containing protein
MACVVHQGSYETIGVTYGEVMAWIEDHSYRIAGSPRETYVKRRESGDDPSTYVTEIKVPVERA